MPFQIVTKLAHEIKQELYKIKKIMQNLKEENEKLKELLREWLELEDSDPPIFRGSLEARTEHALGLTEPMDF